MEEDKGWGEKEEEREMIEKGGEEGGGKKVKRKSVRKAVETAERKTLSWPSLEGGSFCDGGQKIPF